jgi:hypothetical protein
VAAGDRAERVPQGQQPDPTGGDEPVVVDAGRLKGV